MVSRDRRDLLYSATKSKETRNKILARVNTKDSGKRQLIKVQSLFLANVHNN